MINAINSAVSGIRAGIDSLDRASRNVANISTENFDSKSSAIQDIRNGRAPIQPPAGGKSTDLSTEIIAMNLAAHSVKANVTTIKSAQDAYQSILEMGK